MIIGASVKRKEDPRLLAGRGCYVDDVRLPGLVQAALVRSAHAHAEIGSINVARARAMPGVIFIATAADLDVAQPIPVRLGPRPGQRPFLQFPLARRQVRYVGEPVTVVVATDRYVAEDAADVVEVEYHRLPPVANTDQALAPHAALLHEGGTTNLADRLVMGTGEPDAALARAGIRIRRRFGVQRHSGVPLETRGIIASYDAGSGRLSVWGPTKVPHFNRRVLSDLLGIPADRIRFIEPDVGGGFGVRGEFYPEDFLIPWVAIRLRRPVKWIEDRREHMVAANHSREQIHDVELGATTDGRIVALVDRICVDMGAYVRTHGVTVPELTGALLPGPYRIPHYRAEIACVLTTKTPTGTYRAPGRYEGTFVRESMMDLLARAVGVDPVEIRRRNFIPPQEMPFRVGTAALGVETVYDTGAYASSLDAALAAVDYPRMRASQASARAQGRHIGIGLACVVEKAGLGPWEIARVEVDKAGRITVYSGLASLGQGLETTLAQVCAEELHLSVEEITVIHGDTARVPVGVGTFASRGAVVGGSAVLLASRAVKDKLLDRATRTLEAAREDLVMERRRIFVRGVPSRGVTFAELAAASVATEPGISATQIFRVSEMTYPYGTHVAVVEVDSGTGHVTILGYAIAYDVGKAINPMIVDGQLVGGLAQGIGGALLEEMIYDSEGQMLATTFMDYLLPTAAEMPHTVSIRILEETPTPLNPLGIKGAGEGGTAGAGAAIANAVSDALGPLGVEVVSLPLSPDRILELIRSAQTHGHARG
ncbi:MAG TPA: xanthine dehydrogenase family protein molybdopterin-binding subunit [bacterium]|nr:xanthine dehydrogenase family protein molybdopterin-binding subunit [bacterium]